jgi:hypothetical protein
VSLPGTWHSVDPGVEYYAVAVWDKLVLVMADVVPIRYRFDFVPELVVIEKPQIYGDKERARKSDVADLLYAAGKIADRYAQDVPYLPNEWKGQVPKKIHQDQIRARLTVLELDCLSRLPKKKLIHVLDAVGIGLYHMERLGERTLPLGV